MKFKVLKPIIEKSIKYNVGDFIELDIERALAIGEYRLEIPEDIINEDNKDKDKNDNDDIVSIVSSKEKDLNINKKKNNKSGKNKTGKKKAKK